MVTAGVTAGQVWRWLADVPDPEIPVLTITDLGIVRDVHVEDGVTVALAPTYNGCPATEVIEQSVIAALLARGVEGVRIDRRLSPPWTTDWITDDAREKLREYGIAPPAGRAGKRSLLAGDRPRACPRCDSQQSTLVSEFGSTPCKSAWRCNACLEPFEYFKCL